ncbi:DUF4435 domain-containing protein [Flavobacterium gelatinilyticum]|uniref:DUF4435 domain-containing protein n=1 Tax=Flavobacterium gelatinilyticum TaxID=3003260 RepID=UPI0024808511|nr:DUF4435 domain-containing protein [Flavobacterium gelatinilyticum]
MIALSEESQRLTSTFRTYRNDVDIYTEDNEKDKEFYKVLFKRLLKNDLVINDVTPLGCKDIVIKRCNNEPENGRKKIFIVDGDIIFIHGENIPQHENLYVLQGYCIENFLIDKETIVHFLYMSCGTKSIEKIESELNFNEWLEEYCAIFIDLFIHFALLNYFGGFFTLFNADKYHKKQGKKMVFQIDLVNAEILKLKAEILTLTTEDKYDLKYKELSDKWNYCIDNLTQIVSGKDYLIPLLLLKAKQFKKSNAMPTLEEIKFSLVHSSNLNKLSDLKKRIESL